jgi:hypothetical protein
LRFFSFSHNTTFLLNRRENTWYILNVSRTIIANNCSIINIKIRKNVIQNIGINLSDYLSKVNTFILEIDDNEFTEYARNDAYIIFNINSNLINNIVGYYNILNQDHEYINSGQYSIF